MGVASLTHTILGMMEKASSTAYLVPVSVQACFFQRQGRARFLASSTASPFLLSSHAHHHHHQLSAAAIGKRVKVAFSLNLSLSSPVCIPPGPPQPNLPPKLDPLSTNDAEDDDNPGFWVAAATEVAAGCFAIAMCMVTRLPVLGPNFSCSLPALIEAIHLTVPFSIMFWVVDIVPHGLSGKTDDRFRRFFKSRSIAEIAFFCVCVAFGEELLFRAFLLSGTCAIGVPPEGALILSSLIFGVLHAYTTLYIVLASLAGMLFGAMFLSTGNMLTPFVVHFLYDFLTIIVMKFRWRSRTAKK